MTSAIIEKKLARAQKQVQVLEQMIEDKTRELFLSQESLRSANEHFESVIRSMQDMLIVLKPGGVIQSINEQTISLLDYDSLDALIGQPISVLLKDDNGLKEITGQGKNPDKPFSQRESVFKNKNGDSFPVLLSGSTLRDRTGTSCGFVLLALDIRERKVLEQQLLQAQKMESIGQLAAGIAHEINTPIQFIGDNSRFLQEAFSELQPVLNNSATLAATTNKDGDLAPEALQAVTEAVEAADIDYLGEEIPKAVAQVLEGVERVATIVQAMKEFSHPGVEGKTSVNLNHIIESTITVSRNEWKYVANLETDFSPSLPPVSCFSSAISQVILNLIVNAAHAIIDTMEGREDQMGTIRIGTCSKDNEIEVRVSDTGSGIPEGIRKKIFDPFFTTKQVGKGTGQGLALAHSVIVEKHDGTIEVESELGRGTTFIIRLPIEQTQHHTRLVRNA